MTSGKVWLRSAVPVGGAIDPAVVASGGRYTELATGYGRDYERESMGLREFIDEPKRGHVLRAAAIYAGAAWLLSQVADTVGDSFGWPQ